MSTKQTIIFTFMLLSLAGMLYALGAWFYWATELGNAQQTLGSLSEKKADLEVVASRISKLIDDPERSLGELLKKATKQAGEMKGNDVSGATQRENIYNEKEGELKPKWDAAQVKWKVLYADWSKLNKDIAGKLNTLRKQKREKDEKIIAAQAELEKEISDEQVERARMVTEKKNMINELSNIRVAHEEVLDKVSSVIREATRKNVIAPQGEIIYAATDLRSVTINRGSESGIRKGLVFDIYSKSHTVLLKKGSLEIISVRPSSADGLLLPEKRVILQDPNTGWVATNERMRFSPYSGSGADGTSSQPLEKPKSKMDRVEEYKRQHEKNLGQDATELTKEALTAPPTKMGAAYAPIVPGDWINNPDFIPLVPETIHQKQAVEELLTMKDVNISTLTFFFAENVRPYRQEFLKRLCERNACRVTDIMGAEVNYVVSVAGQTNLARVKGEIDPYKDKGEDVTNNIKILRKTCQALDDGRKYGAGVLADDDMEAFFTCRHRKQELLRGKTIQPGQHVFYVAGETMQRSAEELKKWIVAHQGVIAITLDAKVDYVVMGSGLDKAFFDKIKGLGLKLIREDELPRFFGVE
ncbi:MAG: hypothetical protein V1899_08275 [Planctomycetota bacterium]